MRRLFTLASTSILLAASVAVVAADTITIDFQHKGAKHSAELRTFDDKMYAAAYQTFTGSGDLKDAFAIALAAVKQKPNNIQWRENLYQIARWTSHDDLAMEQLLELINRTNKLKFINLGIQLSEELGDSEIVKDLLMLKAKHVSLSEVDQVKLARSHEELGDPETAIAHLKQQWKEKKKVVYLKKLADVYARMGALKLEVQVLKLLQKYEVKTTASVVREARAYYAQNKLAQAFEVLLSIKRTAKKSDKEYWELYADTAWHLQKMDDAMYAFRLMYKHKQLSSLNLQRYINLIAKQNVIEATRLSVEGWKQFKNPAFLLWFVQYSLQMNDWSAFQRTYQGLGKVAKVMLSQMPLYKTARIQVFLKDKDYAAARKAYLAAIKADPENVDIKLTYLWFLIDRKEKPELRERLIAWDKLKFANDDFTLAFAVAYRLLDYPYQAIALLYRGLPKHMQDVVYLTNYLDQMMELRSSDGEPTDAERQLRHYIWALIQLKAKQPETWKDKTFKVNYAKVAYRLAPGQPTVGIMNYLSQYPMEAEASDVLMAWALANQHYALAKKVYHREQLAKVKVAPWIQLTLALHSYDKDKMHALLNTEVMNLPHRDRTVAAHDIGEETQSEQLAYLGLEEFPNNQKTYELFRQTMLPRADYWEFDPEHVTTQLLMWQDYETGGRYYVTPTVALLPYFYIRDQHGRDSTFITNVPNTDTQAGLDVHKILPRGYLDGSLGMRDAMKTFVTSEWKWFYRLTDKWDMLWTAGIHQEANESDYMTAGAMQNRIGVTFFDRVTVRDLISFEATQHYFYGQDEEPVSNGQIYRAAYTHYMWLRYPDYFYRIYGSVNKFHNVPDVTGSLDTLVPQGQQASASGQLLLPSNFVQYGFAVGVGEKFREEYTHEWKPFAIASVFRNNNSRKLGTVFDGGIAGSVFGRDHLALFASHSTGVVGNSNTRFVLGAAYRVYF